MEISIFLAKVLGLYLTIIGAGMILNGKKLRPMLLKLVKDPGMVLMSGFMALIIGILIVVSHNVWVMGWPVIITVIGYLSILKGVVRFMFPEMVIKKISKCVDNKKAYYISLFITLVLGLVLLYFGYMHDMHGFTHGFMHR